jgi:hypothetical protein
MQVTDRRGTLAASLPADARPDVGTGIDAAPAHDMRAPDCLQGLSAPNLRALFGPSEPSLTSATHSPSLAASAVASALELRKNIPIELLTQPGADTELRTVVAPVTPKTHTEVGIDIPQPGAVTQPAGDPTAAAEGTTTAPTLRERLHMLKEGVKSFCHACGLGRVYDFAESAVESVSSWVSDAFSGISSSLTEPEPEADVAETGLEEPDPEPTLQNHINPELVSRHAADTEASSDFSALGESMQIALEAVGNEVAHLREEHERKEEADLAREAEEDTLGTEIAGELRALNVPEEEIQKLIHALDFDGVGALSEGEILAAVSRLIEKAHERNRGDVRRDGLATANKPDWDLAI